MRRTFGLTVLLGALASGQASLAQQDPQQLQQQQDRQQREVPTGSEHEFLGSGSLSLSHGS